MNEFEISIFDGLTGFDVLRVEANSWVVRFLSPHAGVGVFHIEDPKAARKLRKLLKPLAKRA